MIVERGIVPKPLGAKIFDAITRVDAAGDAPGATRSSDYLKVEQDLMAAGGPDISRLHSGRSRQDIGSTTQRLITRDDFLTAFEKLNGMRDALLALAAQAPNAIIPAYTWGVQAQPITFGHYLLGLCRGVRTRRPRGCARLMRVSTCRRLARRRWARRVSRSTGRGWPNCSASTRVAENSLDANQISPIDGGAEIAGLATAGALTLSALDRRCHGAICPDRAVDLAASKARRPAPAASCRKSAIRAVWSGCAPKPAI